MADQGAATLSQVPTQSLSAQKFFPGSVSFVPLAQVNESWAIEEYTV